MSVKELGYGVQAYFSFIEYIILLCVILLLLNLPLFWIFKDHSVYADKPLASLTLGNFGGATSLCEQLPHHYPNSTLRLKCSTGTLQPLDYSHDHEKIL